MQLRSVYYEQFRGTDREWILDNLLISNVNLLVGRNSTGKTRTLNLIQNLSNLLTGDQKNVFTSGKYDAKFDGGQDSLHYTLEYNNSVVTKEVLESKKRGQLLQRGEGGYGKILAEAIEIEGQPSQKTMMKFEVPNSQIAAFTKRDNVQHGFLRPLHEWAASVRHFKLGYDVSPFNLAMLVRVPTEVPVNERDTSQVVPIFLKARKDLGNPYVAAVISDMRQLGYDIEEIDIKRPTELLPNVILPGELVGISIREKGINAFVDQPSISQGMFRAFSLLAQVNYYVLSKKSACILADDIGEGLDFERSRALVEVLTAKAKDPASGIQLLMSSNDRFVMNKVPLEYWTVLQRVGHRVRVRNYQNSREAFEEYKDTGLSNFDFFATDFLETEKEVVARE